MQIIDSGHSKYIWPEFFVYQRIDTPPCSFPVVSNKQLKIILLFLIPQSPKVNQLKSWFVFLFSNTKIDQERLSLLYKSIDLKYQYFDDFLSDIIHIRNSEFKNNLGVSHWDYIERPSGIVYSPPTVENWILYGVVALLLKGEIPRIDETVIPENRDFHFLPDKIERILNKIKSDLSIWENFIGLKPQTNKEGTISINELFDQRAREITLTFERLRIIIREAESKELAKLPVDHEKISRFKDQLAIKWDAFCNSFKLFYHFGNVLPTHDSEGLPTLGATLYMDRYKLMFIENDQPVYGSEDIGADIGRKTDNTFITNLLSKQEKNIKEFDSIEEALKANMAILTNREYNTDLIIVPPEFIYATNLRELPDFTLPDGDNDSLFPILGHFKKIPITAFYTPILKDQLIMLSFTNATQLEIFDGYEYCENKLHIDIRELTAKDVENELENRLPPKEDMRYQEINPIKIRNDIQSSLYLSIWSKAKFIITNDEAYTISRIKNVKI